MSDFWFNCDSCGRQNVGVTFVNGMRFCAKCYQETFGNANVFEKELKDKIKVLEKALELACEDVWNSDYECIQADYDCWQELINVYKTNAKEMIKSE